MKRAAGFLRMIIFKRKVIVWMYHSYVATAALASGTVSRRIRCPQKGAAQPGGVTFLERGVVQEMKGATIPITVRVTPKAGL